MLTANNPFKNFFIIEIKYLKNMLIILIQICEEKLEILQSNVCFRYKKRSAYADLFRVTFLSIVTYLLYRSILHGQQVGHQSG